MNEYTTTYDDKVTYWMLDALNNGATLDDLPSAIAEIDAKISKLRYGANLKPIRDGWKKALVALNEREDKIFKSMSVNVKDADGNWSEPEKITETDYDGTVYTFPR